MAPDAPTPPAITWEHIEQDTGEPCILSVLKRYLVKSLRKEDQDEDLVGCRGKELVSAMDRLCRLACEDGSVKRRRTR